MKNILTTLAIVLIILNGFFMFGIVFVLGTGGDQAQAWYFIPLGIGVISGLAALHYRRTYLADNGKRMIVLGFVIPILTLIVAFSLNQLDIKKYEVAKEKIEASCSITQIGQYKYKVCAGGFTPLNVCDAGYGTSECMNAIKVWDQNHKSN